MPDDDWTFEPDSVLAVRPEDEVAPGNCALSFSVNKEQRKMVVYCHECQVKIGTYGWNLIVPAARVLVAMQEHMDNARKAAAWEKEKAWRRAGVGRT